MARAFRATTRGYTADLDAHERRLISGLCADVIQLLEARAAEVSGAAEVKARPQTPQHDDDAASTAGSEPSEIASSQAEDDDVFAHFRRELEGLGEEVPDAGMAPPEDPVLARLLPDAWSPDHASDRGEAGQFRRLSEASLRESKISDLRTARMLLESSPVRLREEQAPIFGRALNDLRLTLSVRLGIEDEDDAEQIHQMAVDGGAKTTETFMAEIYTFLTWLQETLFSAMLDVLPDE
ncbi:DUF2017 family protein [Nesterenkonia flava]|uniref:DUF2017 family protein n=1 Tax=Nesterenkonia flava TaxID=469799 RepID=A0ABU1FSZ8_9MICC|nr:DUF2017 family protein [Nesterenkonia flava]MDR5711452.1 DUF2017 family protein [Nesterenkonia flava]